MSTDYVLERNPQKCHNDKSGNNIHFVLAYSEEIESAPTMTDIHRSEDEKKQKFPYAKRFSKFQSFFRYLKDGQKYVTWELCTEVTLIN